MRKKKLRRVFFITSCIVIGLVGLFFFTGLYVVPHYHLATSYDACRGEAEVKKAETLWYWRSGLGTPFIVSDGGMLINLKKEGLSFFDRVNESIETRKRIQNRVFLHLPYMEFLYRLSAEGRPPVKYDEAF